MEENHIQRRILNYRSTKGGKGMLKDQLKRSWPKEILMDTNETGPNPGSYY
jgi:hypothetical protein